MHVSNCSGCARRRAAIQRGMGSLWDTAASLFTGAMSEGGSGSSPMSQPSSNTVSPNIQVSPNISPVFQQQFQPTNSAATAGTTQNLPTSQSSSQPGGVPSTGGGFTPVSVPQTNIPMPGVSGASQWGQYIPWAVGGLIALFAIKTFGEKRSRKNAP